MKENYGKIFVDFGEPISAKEFFADKIDRSLHGVQPVHLQHTTEQERKFSNALALDIVHSQQKHCVITTFTMVAIVLSYYLMRKKELKLENLLFKIQYMRKLTHSFNILTEEVDERNSLFNCFQVHKNLIDFDEEENLLLKHDRVVLDNIDHSKLKGHQLDEETMTLAVPYVMLQIYVNPALHYLINSSIILKVLFSSPNVTAHNGKCML